jgi:hypothetical protein
MARSRDRALECVGHLVSSAGVRFENERNQGLNQTRQPATPLDSWNSTTRASSRPGCRALLPALRTVAFQYRTVSPCSFVLNLEGTGFAGIKNTRLCESTCRSGLEFTIFVPPESGDFIMTKRYRMTISRLTVDKLGVKLYDRVSAVIAELVANSYDADATSVSIRAPMGELLATKKQGELVDKGFEIEVTDNGIGMTPEEVNQFYLIVGAERRNDPKRGDTSKKLHRKVMGRKGVGKIAPFGVCQRIEVISSGGDKVKGEDKHGRAVQGYRTAHLILEWACGLASKKRTQKLVICTFDFE